MSIAVGFGDFDWTVICADRQLTVADAGLKFEGSKIAWTEHAAGKRPYLSGDDKPHAITFAYCGIPERARVLVESVTDELRAALVEADECDVYESEYFRQALLPVYKSKDAKGLQTLVGLQTASRCFLYTTRDDQVAPGEREFIGAGDSSVLRYFSDLAATTTLTCEQATMLAIYLVALASRYVDGCGLGLDVAILEHDKPLRIFSKAETEEYSERFVQFERQMGKEFFSQER